MDVKKFRDVIGYGQDRKIKEKDSSGGIEAELVKTLENIVDSDGKITYTEREARKDINIEKGNTDEIIAAGAHALFLPCGTGHMMGLDVHDMENLGEVWVG